MYKAYDDETLVYMTLAGRQDAYGELVLRWQGAALAAANSVLRSVYLSEDAVQDAFIAAWMKLNTLAEPSKFGPWVCKAAKNRAKNILRTYSGWMDISVYENKEDDGVPSPEESVISADEKEEVRRAIESLPQKVRTVITLHYFEGLSVAEIADRMRIPVGTVKWQLSDGRKRLRGELSAMDENYNDTLLQKVMKKVEELKLWSSKTSKEGFDAAYRDVLSDVTDLPESEKKYHAMADVLLRGFWWLPGKKNDEMLARIADAAEKGHNDEATRFICQKDNSKLSGEALIEYIRDKQIPRMEGKGLPVTLGSLWDQLAYEYLKLNKTGEAFAAADKAVEMIPETDARRAAAKDIRTVEELRTGRFKDTDKSKYTLSSKAAEIKLDGAEPVVYPLVYGHGSGEGFCFIGDAVYFPYFASNADGILYKAGAKPGEPFVTSDGASVTLISDGETVVTPAGTFYDCELWEQRQRSEYNFYIYRYHLKTGVGVVKFTVYDADEEESIVLSSYKTSGKELLPLGKGSEWEYVRDGGDSLDINLKLKVDHNDGKKAVISSVSYIERKYYDENSFTDMALALRCEYYDEKSGKLVDATKYAERLTELAKTKAEKIHAKAANAVWARIRDTDETKKEANALGLWNFFMISHLYENDGCVMSAYESRFQFEWKNWVNRGDPVLYNGICEMLQYNTGFIYSDQWVPGYHTEKEIVSFSTDIKESLVCEDAGAVTVKAGTFDNCIRVSLDTDGLKPGLSYICGKKDFVFAPGIGIIRSDNYYAGKTRCAVYELTSYEGTGEGYFPYGDGLIRRYDLIDPPDGLQAYSEYYFTTDKHGRPMMYVDKCGIKNKQPAPECYVTKDEQTEKEIYAEGKYPEYYALWGKNNLEILLHQIDHHPDNPTGDGRLYAEWHKYRLGMIEAFCGGEVLPAWYGFYAEVCFRAAVASFGCGSVDDGKKYMELAFEYFEKWNGIEDGAELKVGSDVITGSLKVIKGEDALILQTGERSACRERYEVFSGNKGDIMYVGLTAKRGWEWFDPVRNEPFFAEYVERSRKYLK